MKLGMVITQTDPETVFNALRLAQYSLKISTKSSAIRIGS